MGIEARAGTACYEPLLSPAFLRTVHGRHAAAASLPSAVDRSSSIFLSYDRFHGSKNHNVHTGASVHALTRQSEIKGFGPSHWSHFPGFSQPTKALPSDLAERKSPEFPQIPQISPSNPPVLWREMGQAPHNHTAMWLEFNRLCKI